MKITDPVLVPDVSSWCDHINPTEMEDGGCQSVVVGFYPKIIGGAVELDPISRQQCIDVATKSQMVLQIYFWDDIILDPIKQADWLVNTMNAEGLPIAWAWADQEQWWSDWTARNNAVIGKISWDQVPRATPGNLSIHYYNFAKRLHDRYPQMGVYTNRSFVVDWAPYMDTWLTQHPAWVPQYGRQPATATQMTWNQLKANWLPNYDIILSDGQPPVNVKGHQFTGDICILPGAYDKFNQPESLDVSVFSQAFINLLRGGGVPVQPSPAPAPLPAPQPPHPDICPTCGQPWPQTPITYTTYSVIYERINVRAAPNGAWVRYAVQDEVLHAKLPQVLQDGYIQLTDSTWVWLAYLKNI